MNKQWILLLLLSFTLSACLQDDKNSSLTLPAINPNLSTESPVGIWLFHMNIDVTEDSSSPDKQRDKSNHYFIRQLVTIKQTEEDNEFWLSAGCGYYSPINGLNSLTTIDDDIKLPASWKLNDEQLQPTYNPKAQGHSQMEFLNEYDPEFSWS